MITLLYMLFSLRRDDIYSAALFDLLLQTALAVALLVVTGG